MAGQEILPICTTREIRGRIQYRGKWYVPLYCMFCGKQRGYRNEPEPGTGYVGYVCEGACAALYTPIAGYMMTPDEAFAETCTQEQIDSYGRVLTPLEQVEALKDGGSILSKLLRDKK